MKVILMLAMMCLVIVAVDANPPAVSFTCTSPSFSCSKGYGKGTKYVCASPFRYCPNGHVTG
uniref:Uncharacterized protein n=1 Tax=Ciona intestinalis TaxID=7719 RepID=F6ZPG7_CIOIN